MYIQTKSVALLIFEAFETIGTLVGFERDLRFDLSVLAGFEETCSTAVHFLSTAGRWTP